MAMAAIVFVGCGKEENNNGRTADNGGGNGGGNSNVEWVDLGLPSGLLWASCNVGANSPECYGEYFAWGETEPKSVYSWSTYCYCTVDSVGGVTAFTKYVTSADYGTVDNLTTLQPSDDAAIAHMGNGARTPTQEEWQELMNNTTVEWTTLNGVNGRKFTANNGNSLFLPAAGGCSGSGIDAADSVGCYWSASLNTDYQGYAWGFGFDLYGQNMYDYVDRRVGESVRAVRDSQN